MTATMVNNETPLRVRRRDGAVRTVINRETGQPWTRGDYTRLFPEKTARNVGDPPGSSDLSPADERAETLRRRIQALRVQEDRPTTRPAQRESLRRQRERLEQELENLLGDEARRARELPAVSTKEDRMKISERKIGPDFRATQPVASNGEAARFLERENDPSLVVMENDAGKGTIVKAPVPYFSKQDYDERMQRQRAK